MKKRIPTLLVILMCASVFAQSQKTAAPAVYTCGYFTKPDNSTAACYWEGLRRTALSLPNDVTVSSASSIFVGNRTVYTAGYYSNGVRKIACYWEGVKRKDLTDGQENAVVNSIFVAGSRVYIGGYTTREEKTIATYWLDGKAAYLTDGSSNATVEGIFVANGKVFTCGNTSQGKDELPCFWEDTARRDIVDSKWHEGVASAIFVSGQTIYVCGQFTLSNYGSLAWYWDSGNSSLHTLTPPGSRNPAYVYSIFASGDKVYVAGDMGGSSAAYWDGTSVTELFPDEGYSTAAAVAAIGGKVYVAGYSYESWGTSNYTKTPWYWDGAKRIMLSDGTGVSSVSAIFIPGSIPGLK